MGFCDYLKEIETECHSCFENGIGACHIKIGSQKYFPKEFQLWDTVQIIRHDHNITVETDIEVTYKTEFPYGLFAGKGPQFAAEWSKKENAMREFIKPKVPPGTTILNSHQHYKPDKFDPNVVAMHIHAHKSVEDLDEAKLIAHKFVEAIRPREINKAIDKT